MFDKKIYLFYELLFSFYFIFSFFSFFLLRRKYNTILKDIISFEVKINYNIFSINVSKRRAGRWKNSKMP